MFSIVDFEQVTVNRYLKRKRTLTKKSREVQSMQDSSTSWVMDFPGAKLTMTQMMVCLTFPRITFFLLFCSRIMYWTKNIKRCWAICSVNTFWRIHDCNHAKCRERIKCSWLCALDHELRTSFRYLRSTPPVYKQNYKK